MPCGSGGVGLLVKTILLTHFKVGILNKTEEGLLWVRLTSAVSDFNVTICVLFATRGHYKEC